MTCVKIYRFGIAIAKRSSRDAVLKSTEAWEITDISSRDGCVKFIGNFALKRQER